MHYPELPNYKGMIYLKKEYSRAIDGDFKQPNKKAGKPDYSYVENRIWKYLRRATGKSDSRFDIYSIDDDNYYVITRCKRESKTYYALRKLGFITIKVCHD